MNTTMKNALKLAIPFALAALTMPALAHDPKMHQQEGAAPADCSKMKDMDMSKMDMNDPVMKAMHEKCKAAMGHDDAHPHGEEGHDMKGMDMKGHDMKGMDMKGHDMKGMDMKTPPPADSKDGK